MNKGQALAIIKLLSAIESWSFSVKAGLPDYLHDNLGCIIYECSEVLLRKEAGDEHNNN